ncbi:hypothetical protein QTP70_016111 [Hemibagrus guttatus]|uniref:Reverse transcriptase/retrotransposon-derived protein RNase H-like domain-containing protein n=1 Tax=Hemibagrus guttatus TaxID=175788 RepID=A0AAE0QP41_9TELE|nr:hypothetical protein QTP70_016111 [Hemibagrus guttatus]KAK3558292.1 hypothetical protein QTP86_014683 [Hemibagrus guttatus]
MANHRKCHLGLTKKQYLGYCIGQGLLRPQEKKVEAIRDYTRPTTKKQLNLTKKGQPDRVLWTEETEQAFQQLKTVYTSHPVLPFTLHTDASETVLGTVLSQVFEGKEHPVLYMSRKLTLAEKNYVAVVREALAIKWAVEELRYYLAG